MNQNPDRVVTHPRNAAFAKEHATRLGIATETTEACPPEYIYVFGPERTTILCDWPNAF